MYMIGHLRHFLRHYFTPYHTNNYRAAVLHSSYFITYLILLLFVQTSTSWMKKIDPDILGYATDITAEKIVELVNRERAKYNLSELTVSNELAGAATAKASDMLKFNYWAHVSPTGTTPWEFITGAGYKYIYAGENLAKNFNVSSDVVDAWMNSPTHRANLLKPEYREIGVSVINGKLQGDDTTLIVQEFGARSREIAKNTKVETPPGPQIPAYQGSSAQIPAQKTNPISYLRINKKVSLYITEFLLVVLCIDALFMWKFKTDRITGHTLSHIIFLMALLGAMGATGIGVIL